MIRKSKSMINDVFVDFQKGFDFLIFSDYLNRVDILQVWRESRRVPRFTINFFVQSLYFAHFYNCLLFYKLYKQKYL
jgi:hypothetical protein